MSQRTNYAFFCFKKTKNKCKFLSFLEYRVSLLVDSYKPVSYKKKRVPDFSSAHLEFLNFEASSLKSFLSGFCTLDLFIPLNCSSRIDGSFLYKLQFKNISRVSQP